MNHNNCLLLFVKSPIKGQVKTRLAAETGGDFEVELYKCFVEDTISLAENLDAHLEVCFFPADRKTTFSKWLGEQHCYRAQTGNNLGERLKNAFPECSIRFGGFPMVRNRGSLNNLASLSVSFGVS